jgi:hypothetical protein
LGAVGEIVACEVGAVRHASERCRDREDVDSCGTGVPGVKEKIQRIVKIHRSIRAVEHFGLKAALDTVSCPALHEGADGLPPHPAREPTRIAPISFLDTAPPPCPYWRFGIVTLVLSKA